MSDYTPPADRCRAALKAAGYSRRQVTVRDSGNCMYSSLHVTIRDASVRISAVEAIAKMHERVDRDSMTGEILSGGNTFVSVEYIDTIVRPMQELIAGGIRGLSDRNEGEVAPGVRVCRADRGFGDAEVWRDGRRWCATVDHAARQIAVECLDAGVTMAMLVTPMADDWIARLDLDDPPATERPRLALVP